jgi:ribosomal protein S18 acetylase RimI-like enzyme
LFEIRPLVEVTGEVVEAFARLIPQLSTANPPDRRQLEKILQSPCVTILLAYDLRRKNAIVGTLTLVIFQTPTNMYAWIEDVVVDEAARHQGLGEALTRAGLEIAAQSGCQFVDLTSRPSRQAANRLYQRIGFQKRSTNLYRYVFEGLQTHPEE